MDKPIIQRHKFGCGVASAAFVLGISYRQVVRVLGVKKADTRGFCCKDLVKMLKDFGLDYKYQYLKPRHKGKIYKKGTIVFIKRSNGFPHGHYLARTEDYWMDPWINFKTDKDIKNTKAGFRKRLPGKPIYALFPKAR